MNVQPTKTTTAIGAQMWRLPTGELHRADGPAVTLPDGSEAWYQHGNRHRVGGPAVTYADGYEYWYQRGKLHRVDGPAIVRPDGSEAWCQHDQLQRVDGPAVTCADGTREWWINGVQLVGFEAEVARRAWEKNGCPG